MTQTQWNALQALLIQQALANLNVNDPKSLDATKAALNSLLDVSIQVNKLNLPAS